MTAILDEWIGGLLQDISAVQQDVGHFLQQTEQADQEGWLGDWL